MNVMTPEFRVSYPNVFKPRLNKLNKKEEYSLVMLFPKGADISALKAAAKAALAEKFGPDETKWPKKLNTPFRDQGERSKEGAIPAGYEAGAVLINARTTNKPGLVKAVGPGKVETIIDTSEFYAGCFAKATLNFWAYNHESGQAGVQCTLNNIMKTREGDPLSGRPRAEDEFEAVATGSAATSAPGLFD